MFKSTLMFQSHMSYKDTCTVIFLNKYLILFKEIIDWYKNIFMILQNFLQNFSICCDFKEIDFSLIKTEFELLICFNLEFHLIYICIIIKLRNENYGDHELNYHHV